MQSSKPKLAGRPPGVTNKVRQAEVREFLSNELEGGPKGYLTKLYQTIQLVKDPAKKAKLMIELAEFWMPKLKAVDVNLDGGDSFAPIAITFIQEPVTRTIDVNTDED